MHVCRACPLFNSILRVIAIRTTVPSSMTAMSSVSSLQSYTSQTVPNSPKSVQVDMPELPSYHPKFYIEEGMTTFLVENRIFKIHHHFLVRESEGFRTIIMRPRDPADSVIPLPGVTCLEFEALLDFFYNGMHEDYDPTLDEWVALLSISTRFGMEKIRKRAIYQIDDEELEVGPIEKILLANSNDIKEWLAPAYAALCQRAKPLEVWEAEKLGLITAVKLAQVREEIRETALASHPPRAEPDTERAIRQCESCNNHVSYNNNSCEYCGHIFTPLVEDSHARLTRTLGFVNDVFWPKPNVFEVIGGAEGASTKGMRVVRKRGNKTKK